MESKGLVRDGNERSEIHKSEAIFISLDCHIIPNVIGFHPITKQKNGFEYPII
jgi:hypothetical protein